jgi:hypothetical protein
LHELIGVGPPHERSRPGAANGLALLELIESASGADPVRELLAFAARSG